MHFSNKIKEHLQKDKRHQIVFFFYKMNYNKLKILEQFFVTVPKISPNSPGHPPSADNDLIPLLPVGIEDNNTEDNIPAATAVFPFRFQTSFPAAAFLYSPRK